MDLPIFVQVIRFEMGYSDILGFPADVNGDGVVNVLDLVAIAKAMERNPLSQ